MPQIWQTNGRSLRCTSASCWRKWALRVNACPHFRHGNGRDWKIMSMTSGAWFNIRIIFPGIGIPIINPDSYGANMGPTWVLSAPDGPHIGPMNLAIREVKTYFHNGNPYTGKTSLYWGGPQDMIVTGVHGRKWHQTHKSNLCITLLMWYTNLTSVFD